MKELLKKLFTPKFFIIAGIVLAVLVSAHFFGHDNQIEEFLEEILERETGIDIDLTPSSRETN